MKTRCKWVNENPLMIKYHDEEWGNPVHDDLILFEYIILDAFQAGLSWNTVINKRENFRKAFSNFDPIKISRYTKKDFDRLLNDKGIIRNKAKINSAIVNAGKFLEIKKDFESFDKYIWQFVNHKTINNNIKDISKIPSKDKNSDKMSEDMKKRGFKFVGSTICYAFMQAAGLVNDHTIDCFRYKEVKKWLKLLLIIGKIKISLKNYISIK